MRKKSNIILVAGALAFIVGSGLVVGTLRGSDDAVASGDIVTTVLVAREAIPAGTTGDDAVEQGLVVAREIATDQRVTDALGSLTDLAGRVLDLEVAPGEQVRTSQLRPQTLRATAITIPDGKQGVAVQLPFVAGGAGYVGAGDRVNVYGNVAHPTEGVVTKLVLANLEVLDVSTEVAPRVAGSTGEERPVGNTVTYLLALDANEAEHMIFLAANAEVWLALVGDKDAVMEPTTGRRFGDILP